MEFYALFLARFYIDSQTFVKLLRIPFLVKPALTEGRYLTTEQMLTHLHISRRTLQNYRDKGIIPYIRIGGITLYPESGINEVPEENYYSVLSVHKAHDR
jgi:hypothetical protein